MLALQWKDMKFPALRRLRFQVSDPPNALHFKGNFSKLVTGFLQNCTELTDLYISFSSMPKLILPSSLVTLSLSIHHDRVAFGSNVEVFVRWDAKMHRMLNSNELSKLRKLVIVMYCRDPIVGESKGMEMLRLAFKQTLQWCRRNGITVDFEDEKNSAMCYDERMNNFVFA